MTEKILQMALCNTGWDLRSSLCIMGKRGNGSVLQLVLWECRPTQPDTLWAEHDTVSVSVHTWCIGPRRYTGRKLNRKVPGVIRPAGLSSVKMVVCLWGFSAAKVQTDQSIFWKKITCLMTKSHYKRAFLSLQNLGAVLDLFLQMINKFALLVQLVDRNVL